MEGIHFCTGRHYTCKQRYERWHRADVSLCAALIDGPVKTSATTSAHVEVHFTLIAWYQRQIEVGFKFPLSSLWYCCDSSKTTMLLEILKSITEQSNIQVSIIQLWMTPIWSQTLTFPAHERRPPQAPRRSIPSSTTSSSSHPPVCREFSCLADERGQASSPELPLESSSDVSTRTVKRPRLTSVSDEKKYYYWHQVSCADPAVSLQRGFKEGLSQITCCCPFHMEVECG